MWERLYVKTSFTKFIITNRSNKIQLHISNIIASLLCWLALTFSQWQHWRERESERDSVVFCCLCKNALLICTKLMGFTNIMLVIFSTHDDFYSLHLTAWFYLKYIRGIPSTQLFILDMLHRAYFITSYTGLITSFGVMRPSSVKIHGSRIVLLLIKLKIIIT